MNWWSLKKEITQDAIRMRSMHFPQIFSPIWLLKSIQQLPSRVPQPVCPLCPPCAHVHQMYGISFKSQEPRAWILCHFVLKQTVNMWDKRLTSGNWRVLMFTVCYRQMVYRHQTPICKLKNSQNRKSVIHLNINILGLKINKLLFGYTNIST